MGNVVAFLGVCDKAAYTGQLTPGCARLNLLGLSRALISPVYPCPIAAHHMVFALEDAQSLMNLRIHLVDDSGKVMARLSAKGKIVGTGAPETADQVCDALDSVPVLVSESGPSWFVLPVSLKGLNVTIPRPGNYTVVQVQDGDRKPIGSLVCGLLEAPPLTPERVAAIRSDPKAATVVNGETRCNNCGDKLRFYAALDVVPKLVARGYVRNTDLPDKWRCSCGKQDWDMQYYKTGLPALLGRHSAGGDVEMDPSSRYTRQRLAEIAAQLRRLLDADPTEEQVHSYISANPILWHQFSATRIYSKTSIMTPYKVDFAILSTDRALHLIEIEKPAKKLLKQDGHRHSDFTGACDQVKDWLAKFREQRAACLDGFKLKSEEVTAVKGVVVMGRDASCSDETLRKLKAMDLGDISLYTYDDLLSGLDALQDTIEAT